MKGQFAFLQLVLFCGDTGNVFKDATEMSLIVEARLVCNIGQCSPVAVHKVNSRAEFFMNHQFFRRNAEQSLRFTVYLAG